VIGLKEELLYENKRFIADTVHQIRTPLTNIMMNNEMIKLIQKDEVTSEYIDQINASINMLSNSYEDLAYITSYGTIEYKPAPLSLTTILEKRIRFFATISKVNFKELRFDIEKNLIIQINEIEIERIIDNNLTNDIKYGTVHQPITIILMKKENQIIVEFKSYGNPIKNKVDIFEKNYRENESKRGLGLGLNMVKTICKKYDIQYKVVYEEGQNIFHYIFKH
jgi:signal transduction histidine kinase